MKLTNRCLSRQSVVLAFPLLTLLACSSQDAGTSGTGSGGSSAVGSGGASSTGSGGTLAGSGGAAQTGSGGATATGSGGASATGSGGTVATGSGGAATTNTGGSSATGGVTGSGGAIATGSGGSLDAGGTNPADGGTDGRPADGGGQPDGGMTVTDAGSTTNYNPCPAKGTVCRIMPMGDSITEGYRSTGYGGYRALLFHLALTDKKSITFVGSAPLHGPATVDGVTFPQENEGIGGRRIQSLVDILPTTITTNKPHIVLVMIGTNDIASGAASMGTQMAKLLDKLLAADASMMVVVATVVPTTTDSKTTTVKAFDDMLPAMVKERADAGKHIMLVDMYAKFVANANWKTVYFKANDDLHPSDAGYSLMADVYYAGIKSFLP